MAKTFDITIGVNFRTKLNNAVRGIKQISSAVKDFNKLIKGSGKSDLGGLAATVRKISREYREAFGKRVRTDIKYTENGIVQLSMKFKDVAGEAVDFAAVMTKIKEEALLAGKAVKIGFANREYLYTKG